MITASLRSDSQGVRDHRNSARLRLEWVSGFTPEWVSGITGIGTLLAFGPPTILQGIIIALP
jgi:hypothetical protein